MFRSLSIPKPLILVLLLFTLWLSYTILPKIYSSSPSIFLLSVGLFQKELMYSMKFYFRILVTAAIFLSMITTALIYSGIYYKDAILHSVNTFGLISTMVISIFYLSVSTKPCSWIVLFDKIKVPKTITYLLSTSITSVSLVKEYGSKTISLLELKGYTFSTFYSKITAYIRIVTPVFYVLFNHLQIHARSLQYRGFMQKSIWNKKLEPQWNQGQIIWVIISFFFIIISLFYKLWT